MLETWGDFRVGTKRAARRLGAVPSGQRSALVVTGGSEGLGPALAREFADLADEIVLIARGQDKLDDAARILAAELAKPVKTFAIDLTRSEAPNEVAEFMEREGLDVHVLINSAGVGHAGPALDQPAEKLARMLDLNVRACSLMVHRFLPGMLARGSGGIVNVASLGGYFPAPFQTHYYASKAQVLSFTEALAYETLWQGVRLVALAPGPVDTGFHSKMGGDSALYRYVLPSMQPKSVARAARRGYALGQRVVIPGVFNRLLAILSGVIPHIILMPVLALLMKPPQR